MARRSTARLRKALFGVIGEAYGVGNGNTTFHLPDLRGRFPLGLDNMGGTSADVVTAAEADSLNGSGGAETHTLTIDEMRRPMTIADMRA